MNVTRVQRGVSRDASLRARSLEVIPGGMYGHQDVRLMGTGMPQFMERGEGSRVWDADGNEYVDLMCSYGPILLGHRHPAVEEAAERQRSAGDCQNGPSEVMVELAERLVKTVRHADWAMFLKNGTDATTLCLMIARAKTGRSTVLRAVRSYHGVAPWCTPSRAGLTVEDRANILEFRYNDLESVERAAERAGPDLAAIIVSPFRHDAGVDQELVDPAFARGLRALCDRLGASLIIDDIRTGLRLELGGSWEAIGVEPDLSAWSKAIANGYPLAAVLGSEEMRDAARSVFTTGSFWTAAVPMAASIATLDMLEREDGIGAMKKTGRALWDGWEAQAAAHDLEIRLTGPVQMPYLTFEGDSDHTEACIFARACADAGVFLHPRHNWFLSTALDERDLSDVLEATDAAFAAVISART